MWQRASAAKRWGLVVLVVALGLAALDVWWFLTYRHGYPFDIDEAGYTVFGLADYLGLKNNGVQGWWDAIQGQPTFAPLVPAFTSLLVFVKPGILNGYVTLTVFMVVLTMVIYAIGERLAGPKLGALAAVVAATLPGTFAFAREYIFALPTATFLALATYAVLRSDGMRRSGWAVCCGAAIGLMLLSRTMAITYVPGVLLAAALPLAIRGRATGALPRRALNMGLLVVTAIVVAATWYARNLPSVIEYLTDYGYGKQSQYYGHEHALVSWGRLRSVGEHMIGEDLFLPMAAVFLVAAIALVVVAVRRLKGSEDRRGQLIQILDSDAFGLALILIVGYGALMSSQNGGDGFTFPLAVLIPPLAVLALRHFPKATVPATAAVGLIALINIISTATIWSFASHTRPLSLPGIQQELPITKGVPKAVFAIRAQVPGPETVFDAGDKRWVAAARNLSDRLSRLQGPDGEPPVVAFASRNRALSSNSVQLASIEKYQRGMGMVQLEVEPDDSVATYYEQMREPGTTVLITTSSTEGDFPPPVTQAYAQAAGRRLALQKIGSLTLPDGRTFFIWKKRP